MLTEKQKEKILAHPTIGSLMKHLGQNKTPFRYYKEILEYYRAFKIEDNKS